MIKRRMSQQDGKETQDGVQRLAAETCSGSIQFSSESNEGGPVQMRFWFRGPSGPDKQEEFCNQQVGLVGC